MTDFLRIMTDESDRFLDAIVAADPSAQVPTCPDWTAADLVWHLTEVHDYWARILADGALTDEDAEVIEQTKPERPTDREAAVALFRDRTEALAAELRDRADDQPAWFWLDSAKTVGSTRRMQAHEATMHRIDAELTAGVASAPVDPALAVDGIEHAVDVMWAYWATLPGFAFTPSEGAVELVATDLDRTWQVQPGRWLGTGQSGKAYDEPGVLLEAGDVLATVVGTAQELDRWLWGRGPEPETSGDDATLDALRAARAQGMN